jgi:hypothetical protein
MLKTLIWNLKNKIFVTLWRMSKYMTVLTSMEMSSKRKKLLTPSMFCAAISYALWNKTIKINQKSPVFPMSQKKITATMKYITSLL